MDNREKQLENRCMLYDRAAADIAAAMDGRLDLFPAVRRELTRLRRRAREYEHGSFITLVVGPAKSGKSTLVNLLADAYVSPTNFLECTVRPSVISRRAEGEENSLCCYTSSDDSDKVEKIDFILDIVRGFEREEMLEGVKVERLPLNADTIKEKIELGLNDSLNSSTLLTSLRTPGGKLLQDRVFIIDMPGFDGAYQNIDNPVYETVARRADLIIFVQSSNAAFSKVSKEFLSILARTNRNVPVALVHNVFDAAWWHDEAEKEAIARRQRDFAVAEIGKLGFNNIHHAYTINLGAVTDSRSGRFGDMPHLAAAAAEFDRMEEELFQSIINRRDALRLENCLNRFDRQLDILRAVATDEMAASDVRLQRYDSAAEALANFRVLPLPTSPEPSMETIDRIVEFICASTAQAISADASKSTSEVRTILEGMLERISEGLNANIRSIYGLDSVENRMSTDFRTAIADNNMTLAPFGVKMDVNEAAEVKIDVQGRFALAGTVDFDNLIPSQRSFTNLLGRHKGIKIHDYIATVRELLSQKTIDGLAGLSGGVVGQQLPAINMEMAAAVAAARNACSQTLEQAYRTAADKALANIMPSPDKERAGREALAMLLDKTYSLK